MDINEIKQVPIVDFLYILGIEPVKHKASGLWYHAPYRNDRNPSLRVSTLSLQKIATKSHKNIKNKDKAMITEDSSLPLSFEGRIGLSKR